MYIPTWVLILILSPILIPLAMFVLAIICGIIAAAFEIVGGALNVAINNSTIIFFSFIFFSFLYGMHEQMGIMNFSVLVGTVIFIFYSFTELNTKKIKKPSSKFEELLVTPTIGRELFITFLVILLIVFPAAFYLLQIGEGDYELPKRFVFNYYVFSLVIPAVFTFNLAYHLEKASRVKAILPLNLGRANLEDLLDLKKNLSAKTTKKQFKILSNENFVDLYKKVKNEESAPAHDEQKAEDRKCSQNTDIDDGYLMVNGSKVPILKSWVIGNYELFGRDMEALQRKIRSEFNNLELDKHELEEAINKIYEDIKKIA